MKMMVWMALVLVWGIVSAARAETLERTRIWAESSKPEDVRGRLARLGAGADEHFDLITDGWRESMVVDVALERNRIDLLAWVLERDILSDDSVQRVLDDQGARERPSDGLWGFVARLPREQRPQFETTLKRLIPHRFGSRPVFGELELKYQVLRGEPAVSANTDTLDLVRLLLAVEHLDLRSAERLREAITHLSLFTAKIVKFVRVWAKGLPHIILMGFRFGEVAAPAG
jgi:hypothetical protein